MTFPRALLLGALFVGTTCPACARQGPQERHEQAGSIRQAISSSNSGVLGFEDVTDWFSNSATLSLSSLHSEGSSSIQAVAPEGWNEVTNATLMSSSGGAGENLTYDLYLDALPAWGETRAIVILPSQGEWWRDLGGRALTTLVPGTFNTISFPIPADLRAKLASPFSDLQVKIVILSPSGTYRLDALSLGEPSGGTTACDELGEPDVPCNLPGVPLSFVLPAGPDTQRVVLAASNSLRLGDRAEILGSGSPLIIANTGLGNTDIGADSNVETDVVSTGPVNISDRATVAGDVRSSGVVTVSSSASTGQVVQNTPIETLDQSSRILFPDPGPDVTVPPDSVQELAPGSYAGVTVYSRSTLHLSGGSYYLQSLALEPQSVVRVDDEGPIILYVREQLTIRGGQDPSTDPSKFLIVVTGAFDIHVESPWLGTILAPNAAIDLAPLNGGRHRGSYYSKHLNVDAGCIVEFVPFFDWDFVSDDVAQRDPPPTPPPLPTTAGSPPTLACTGDVAASVDDFLSWATRSRSGDWEAAKTAVNSVTCPSLVAEALIGKFEAARLSRHALAVEALAALGQLRSTQGEDFLTQLVQEPLPTDEIELRREEFYHIMAVRGLGYMGSATADAMLRDIVANHESRRVRGEGIRVYLFSMPPETRQHLVGVVRPEDEVLLDRFENRDWGQGQVSFDEELAAYVTAHPESVVEE